MSERMSKVMAEDLSDRRSKEMSERMSKDMLQRMSERMSKDMSEDMSEKMSKGMSEDMSERMKCDARACLAAKLLLCHVLWLTRSSLGRPVGLPKELGMCGATG